MAADAASAVDAAEVQEVTWLTMWLNGCGRYLQEVESVRHRLDVWIVDGRAGSGQRTAVVTTIMKVIAIVIAKIYGYFLPPPHRCADRWLKL
eukprot:549809-Prorocentrum_minimum.AAC.1